MVTYDLKWTSNAEKAFGLTIGTQGMTQKNENFGNEILVPDAEVSDVAGYALARYDYKKFNFLGGLRFDNRSIKAEGESESGEVENDTLIFMHSMDTLGERPEVEVENDYSPFSGSLGFAFHPSERLTFKVNAATGFRAPNYAEIGTFGRHEGTYRFEIGKTDLEMEQNVEGDLGAIWEGSFISFNVSGFYNSISNYIFIANSGDSVARFRHSTENGLDIQKVDTLPVYDFRQADATINGFQIGFDIHPSTAKWLDVKASYAMTRGEINDGGNLPFMPADKIIAEVKLSRGQISKLMAPYLSFVVSNYSEQSRIAEYELPTESYTLLDVHIGFDFKLGKQTASAQLFCTNVLNAAYFNHLSLIKTIGVHEMGRNIGVMIHVPFGL